jgi:hypothetical protein
LIEQEGLGMKYALTLSAALMSVVGGIGVLTPQPAQAVVYCTYIDYPANCVVRSGVRLVARPVARTAVRHGTVHRGNVNGGVNRVGRR